MICTLSRPSTTSSRRRLQNEVWLAGPDGPQARAALLATLTALPFNLEDVVDLQALLAMQGADPLTAAGGTGILLVAFIAVMVLLALAFLVTLFLAAQQRTVEFAVLRALGITRTQIVAVLTLEYALVVAVGWGSARSLAG